VIWSLVSAVFVTSLLGSTHCAGMCGAFVAFAVVGEQQSSAQRTQLHLAYNAGRLLTYLSLGAAAGSVGSALDAGGALLGVQRIALAFAGLCMIAFASIALLRHVGVHLPRVPAPAFMQRALLASHRHIASWPAARRALATGLLTTLLPCGWLYAFVLVAAGTGHVLAGMLVMAIFWLGTLPMLVAVGAGAAALTGPLKARLPVLTMVLLLAMGIFTALGRVTMPAAAMVHASSMREQLPTGEAGFSSAMDQLSALQRAEGPVCHGN
jgi:uncharacterized protein